CRRYC
ncbi:Iron(3+)-hydroxamate import system permease protein FhuB, partial [Haemophilus influenzae]